jgi:hypothetical protein
MRNLGADWIAAIALSIQALIFLIFLWWQDRILHRHAATLEEHTKIAGSQAKTAELIGQALAQQGKILAEQTSIMDKQFKFQRKVDAQAERATVLTLVVAVQGRLVTLDSKLSRATSSATPEYRQEVNRHFDALAGAVYECHKAVFLSLHLTEAQKKFFLAYCDDLAALNQTGNNVKDFHNVRTLKDKYGDPLFSIRLGSLGEIPESSS